MKFIVIIFCLFIISPITFGRPGTEKKSRRNRISGRNGRDQSDLDANHLNIQWKNLKQEGTRKCGYEGCPVSKPDMLNVHIVPHTHDDVGWLKTVDQYYYGSQTKIQKAGVQYILDSVIQSLLKDPERRFIYVETAFFFKWWKHQTSELQSQVKWLVDEGRLEFIGGAWSMNDEATTHYQSIIDQFTWGLRKLNDTFGECGRPRVGWQIDPFGHSREQASLFARMGFDGMFLGRLDFEDKRDRLMAKNAEMIWKGSPNLGEKADLFSGVLYNTYGPPPGFCFDVLCGDDPIIDEKWSPDNNVEKKVDLFFDYVQNASSNYRTNNIIITMGDDFNYQDANMWFKNLDKLIKYANERQNGDSKINLFYSTPSCYLKSLHDSDITWPTKTDDFFPYSSDPHAFWTGYFTSRPTLKRFERVGNHYLQICKQLTAMSPGKLKYFDSHLSFFREEMGIMQHHDAVAGTEKQPVANDYAKRLQVAIDACETNIRSALNQFTTGEVPPNPPHNYHEIPKPPHQNYTFEFKSCLLLNISKCEVSEKSANFIVTIYNPLGYSTYQYVRVPVPSVNYNIVDYKGVNTPMQFIEVAHSVRNLKYRFSPSEYELVFLANELPPMGYKSYYVSKNIAEEKEESVVEIFDKSIPTVIQIQQDAPAVGFIPEKNEDVVIGNKYLNISFGSNGLVSSILADGIQIPLTQNFFYYDGAAGDNKIYTHRASGAYIFRPNNTIKSVADSAKLFVTRGHLVDEVQQKFNDWVSQIIRVYKDENYVEFEWMVGPVPVDDLIGKEIVTRFTSKIKSNSIFFTDSNGREMLKRQRNVRQSYTVHLQEEVAGNYYPITTKIALEDDQLRMAILTDRAQGGTSLNDGELEIMIHRRLLFDDGFGVEEALNEKAFGDGLIVRGTHYLVIGKKYGTNPTIVGRERFIQTKLLVSPWPFFSDASAMSFDDWKKQYTNIRSNIALALPANIHLLTYEPWNYTSYLIRFEHILEKDEDPFYSKPVKINLKDTFPNLQIVEIRETNLAANQWINDVQRFKFRPDSEEEVKPVENSSVIKTEPDEINLIAPIMPDVSIDSVIVHDRGASSRYLRRGKKIKDPEELEIIIQPMEIRTFVVYFE